MAFQRQEVSILVLGAVPVPTTDWVSMRKAEQVEQEAEPFRCLPTRLSSMALFPRMARRATPVYQIPTVVSAPQAAAADQEAASN